MLPLIAYADGVPNRGRWVAVAATATATALAGLLVRRAGPWPGALLIRYLFDRDSATVNRALEPHAPAVTRSLRDEPYQPGAPASLLDAHFPASVQHGERLPTVVWLHGGGWLSGSKNNVVPYFQLIAEAGYTVIAVDYSLAPGAKYPVALRQINRALAHVLDQADRYHVDPDRIVLAGDSAGAQLASQIAALTTTPGYSESLVLRSALRPAQLVGMVLHCGYYDMRGYFDQSLLAPPPVRWGMHTLVRAYTGSRTRESAALAQMSTIDHLTAAFPPTFVTGGNTDPLTDAQSRPFAARLTELGVPVTARFFPADHLPALGHEFQFSLDTADGRDVLERTLAFLAERTSGG